ncbi:MAG TPA: hypothetical protein PK708_13920 [Candidatus Competibacter sp.]|nr:hypothetical protein [Candidatus Competibacter sp.]
MESTFKLTVFGIQSQRDASTVWSQLSKIITGNPKEMDVVIQRILTNQPVVLVQDLSSNKAKSFLRALTDIGLNCRVEPMQLSLIPIEEEEGGKTYQCPACGYEQPPALNGQDICQRCGVVGNKYQNYTEYKEVLELERQRVQVLKAQQDKDKAEAAKERANRLQEKKQKEILERARRQAEQEAGMTLRKKLKGFFKSQSLIPVFIGVTAAIGGVGLLVWQLGMDRSTPPPTSLAEGQPGLQINITPPPNTVINVANPVVQTTQTAQVAPASPAGSSGSEVVAQTDNPAGNSGSGATAQTATGSTSGSGPGAIAQTASVISNHNATAPIASGAATNNQKQLIELNKLTFSALTHAADRPSANAKNTRLLIELADYEAETGDIAATTQYLSRLAELVDAPSELRLEQLDAVNRARVEIMVAIASEQYKRKAFSAAQEQWVQAIKLTNAINSPSERALALASLAQSLHDSNTTATSDYFKRAEDNARTISNPALQAATLSALARDLAATGRPEQSREIFAQVGSLIANLPKVPSRLITVGAIAQHRAEAGDNTIAKSLLGEIDSAKVKTLPPVILQYRLQALSAIARNLALSGDILAARNEFMAILNSATALGDPDARDSTLLYLAKTLVSAGDPASADQIVAEVLKNRGVSDLPKTH